MTQLSERRAADRKEMAKRTEELVLECGATFEREENGREIRLEISAAQGLRVLVDFDGKSAQPDVHVLSWNIHYESNARLNDATFGGNVNPHHKHKATYVAYGFDELCDCLRRGLTLAASGDAFLPRDPKSDAAHAERLAAYAAAFAEA
jgi:hypothetical protein